MFGLDNRTAIRRATAGRQLLRTDAERYAPTGSPRIQGSTPALHPRGLAPRVENLAEWGRHIVENLRSHVLRSPDPRIDTLIIELESYLPDLVLGPDHLGFSVPLRLHSNDGGLQLITTLTSFATAVDVTLAELRLEAFLPGDEATAEILKNVGPVGPASPDRGRARPSVGSEAANDRTSRNDGSGCVSLPTMVSIECAGTGAG